MEVGASTLTLTNCSFAGNAATSSSGALLCSSDATTVVVSSIVWGNTSPSNPNIGVYTGATCTVSYSVIGQTGGFTNAGGNLDTDPLFVGSVSPYDLHLQGGSSCIDVGIATGALDHDLDGDPRPSGSGYDMGAYEFQQ